MAGGALDDARFDGLMRRLETLADSGRSGLYRFLKARHGRLRRVLGRPRVSWDAVAKELTTSGISWVQRGSRLEGMRSAGCGSGCASTSKRSRRGMGRRRTGKVVTGGDAGDEASRSIPGYGSILTRSRQRSVGAG